MTRIIVTAAVIDRHDLILVTKRPQGVHLEGHWEFPGGKCDPDETLEGCLRRELKEELAVDAVVGTELLTTTHHDADRSVELHFFQCHLVGEPTPQLGQEMRWIPRHELRRLRFPPADRELIDLLSGSDRPRTE